MRKLEMNLCDRHGGSLPAIFTEDIRTEDTPESLGKYAEEILQYYGCDGDTLLVVYLSSSKMYLDALLTAVSKIGAKLRVGIWQSTGGSNGFYHMYDMELPSTVCNPSSSYDVKMCAWPETRPNHMSADNTDNPINWPAVIAGRLENPFDLETTERLAFDAVKSFAGKHVLLYVNGADFIFVPVLNALLRQNCTVTLQHYNPFQGTSCFHMLNRKEL